MSVLRRHESWAMAPPTTLKRQCRTRWQQGSMGGQHNAKKNITITPQNKQKQNEPTQNETKQNKHTTTQNSEQNETTRN